MLYLKQKACMKKTHDASVEGQTIHVGNGGRSRKRLLRMALAIAGGLVLAAGVVAAVLFWQNRSANNTAAERAKLEKKISSIQNQTLAGDYDRVHDSIQKALADPKLSDTGKLSLYMQDGAAYENEKNYAAAIEAYQKAEAIEPSLGLIQAIATLAVRADDEELAITYYQKALDFLAANNKLDEAGRAYYEKLISDLEGEESSNE
jgi:tetratricopeptide (TPR) repeat protein